MVTLPLLSQSAGVLVFLILTVWAGSGHFQWIDRVEFLRTSSLRITPQMTEFMKVVITQIHKMVAGNIRGVLTVSNIVPRALCVFTLLILTNRHYYHYSHFTDEKAEES